MSDLWLLYARVTAHKLLTSIGVATVDGKYT